MKEQGKKVLMSNLLLN